MSVYTVLEEQDFHELLTQYDVGQLVRFEGIAAGVENTNYRVTVRKNGVEKPYFLTLFEMLDHSELSFFLPYLNHLMQQDCASAAPVPRLSGELVMTIKDTPAALFTCLAGGHPEILDEGHNFKIGAALAKIHLAGQSFNQSRDAARGYYWVQHQVQKRNVNISDDDYRIMQDQLAYIRQQHAQWDDLPRGIIHGDLFPDNALFEDNGALSGVIDFYNACDDVLVYDLAITSLGWTRQPDGSLNTALHDAMIKGYESVRPLTAGEHASLPDCLRLAALRFWLSRLQTNEQQAGIELTTPLDPNEIKRVLLWLSAQSNSLM